MDDKSDLKLVLNIFGHLVDSPVDSSVDSQQLLGKVIEAPPILTNEEDSQIGGFHENLSQCLRVDPELTQHFQRIFNAQGRKIQFVSQNGNAHISETTIVLPLYDKEGNRRSKEDLVDALIFESCNADPQVQEEFDKLDKEFGEKRNMTLEQYGRRKAGIEAQLTVLRAAQLCNNLTKQNITIAQQGMDNIQAIKEKEPLFFEVGGQPDMEKLLGLMCDTQHQKGVIDPKDPTQLKSGELYHYEKVKALGEISFVGIILAAMSQDVVNENIKNWFRQCLQIVSGDRDKQPMLFCLIIAELKKANLGNFGGLDFNDQMFEIASANAPGLQIPPCPVQEVSDPSTAAPGDLEIALNNQAKVLVLLDKSKLHSGFSPARKNEKVARAKIGTVRQAIEKAAKFVEALKRKEDPVQREGLVLAMREIENAKLTLGQAIDQISDLQVKGEVLDIYSKL